MKKVLGRLFQSLIGILADFNSIIRKSYCPDGVTFIGAFQSLIGILADFNIGESDTFQGSRYLKFQSLIGILADFNVIELISVNS